MCFLFLVLYLNIYDYLQKIGEKMGLDTSTLVTLWKDHALVEINLAVLHSFHRDNVTIVDHHSASEQFMKHLETETKLRCVSLLFIAFFPAF